MESETNGTPHYDPKEIKRALLKDTSLFSLILSNLFAIPFALILNWNISLLLWVYWSQGVIIGFFNFLKILLAKKEATEVQSKKRKVSMALFYAFSYGSYYFIAAVLLMSLEKEFQQLPSFQSSDLIQILPLIGIFFVNHLFSFIYNKKRDETELTPMATLFLSYIRVIPMHIMIILSRTYFLYIGTSVAGLIAFLVLKTILDVILHVIVHTPKVIFFLIIKLVNFVTPINKHNIESNLKRQAHRSK